MSDSKWKAKIRNTTDPYRLLEEFIDPVISSGDPYYKEFRDELHAQTKKVLAAEVRVKDLTRRYRQVFFGLKGKQKPKL
jgi:hypothetical protein